MSEPAHSPEKARVLVVDDHPLLREGLVQMLGRQPDLSACSEADSISSAEAAIARDKPDVLVLDLRLGSGDPLDFIKSLRARYENLRILVLSQHDETIFAERCLAAGADGYITKQEAPQEVLSAIRMVLQGEVYISRKVAVLMFRQGLHAREKQEGASIASLSDRELHVFQLIGAGMSCRDIAVESNLSIKTVETHRENIKHKLALDSSAALAERARAWVGGWRSSR